MSGVAADGGAAAAVRRLWRHLRRSRLLAPHRHLLVAVSGGLDSVVLLHALRFGTGARWRLTAAHFDHAMRAGSAADAEWVRGLCIAWEVPLVSCRATEPPRSEAAARTDRYEFLEKAAAGVRADAVLTAHHADDQAETVLFRLLRGSGLRGISGIPARRGRIVRPLLLFTRAHLRAYAREAGLAWREDPSNAEQRFARNRIRHTLLPALERARPGAAGHLTRLARYAARVEKTYGQAVTNALEDVVESRAAGRFALARERLLAYHPHVRARVLRHLSEQLGRPLDRRATRTALEFSSAGASGRRAELPGGLRLEREFETLLLRAAPAHASAGTDVLRIPDSSAGSGTITTGGQKYAVHWAAHAFADAAGHSASFDPSSLRFPLELRGWRAGDRIRLAYGSKKLKKLFQERRIGRSDRARLPVLVDALGQVLWVPGVPSARAADHGGGTGFHIMVADDVSF